MVQIPAVATVAQVINLEQRTVELLLQLGLLGPLHLSAGLGTARVIVRGLLSLPPLLDMLELVHFGRVI